MKLIINPTIIYRTSKFPLNATLENHWDELKDTIKIASPDFYKVIKDIPKEELTDLAPNISFTIWKYFNRAKYRATPFGTFAG